MGEFNRRAFLGTSAGVAAGAAAAGSPSAPTSLVPAWPSPVATCMPTSHRKDRYAQ